MVLRQINVRRRRFSTRGIRILVEGKSALRLLFCVNHRTLLVLNDMVIKGVLLPLRGIIYRVVVKVRPMTNVGTFICRYERTYGRFKLQG